MPGVSSSTSVRQIHVAATSRRHDPTRAPEVRVLASTCRGHLLPNRTRGQSEGEQPRARSPRTPTKLAASVVALLLVSAGGHYLGGTFWDHVERILGVAGPAIDVDVITDVDAFRSNAVHWPLFVIPRAAHEVPPPPDPKSYRGRYPWAQQLGGVDAGTSLVRLIVRGARSERVILQELRLKVVARRPPIRTGVLTSPLPLGDQLTTSFYQAQLDLQSPELDYVTVDGATVDRFPLELSRGESEVIDIQVYTSACDCDWVVAFDYTADGRQHKYEVTDDGRPFRTTAEATTVALPGTSGRGLSARWVSGYSWRRGRWRRDRQFGYSAAPCGPSRIRQEDFVLFVTPDRDGRQPECAVATRLLRSYLERVPKEIDVTAPAPFLRIDGWACRAGDMTRTSRVATCERPSGASIVMSNVELAAEFDAESRRAAAAANRAG